MYRAVVAFRVGISSVVVVSSSSQLRLDYHGQSSAITFSFCACRLIGRRLHLVLNKPLRIPWRFKNYPGGDGTSQGESLSLSPVTFPCGIWGFFLAPFFMLLLLCVHSWDCHACCVKTSWRGLVLEYPREKADSITELQRIPVQYWVPWNLGVPSFCSLFIRLHGCSKKQQRHY